MKSVITCDLEGTILTMNSGAEQIFGYNKDELIGKKRVSLFSPGEIVLQNVAHWLDVASKDGKYNGKTVFVNKFGDKFNAKISITPTFSKGSNKVHDGYCGVSEVIDEEVHVKISFVTKLIKYLAITRMPFSSASILPIFVVAAYFYSVGLDSFSFLNLAICVFGVLFAHLSTNMFNDYFDNIDGTDDGNSDYFQQVSGGSRAVELGLISIEKTKTFAVILLLLALSFGVYTIFNAHPENVLPIFLIASIGLFLGYYYTAPPLRLVSRGGLGELAIFLAFGPLLVLGAAFAVTSYSLLASEHFFNIILIGTPIGLLTTNILLINEFPDRESDMSTGKNHIVAVLGKKNSRYVYLFILSLVAIMTFYLAFEVTSFLFIPLILVVFYGFKICLHLFKYFDSRALVTANWDSIKLQAGYCILMIFSFILNAII